MMISSELEQNIEKENSVSFIIRKSSNNSISDVPNVV